MGPGQQIVNELRSQGFTVRLLSETQIGVSPSEHLTDEIRQTVTSHKKAILNFLTAEQAEMSEETGKIAKMFDGAYVPRGVDLAVALMGARMMATGSPVSITFPDGKFFAIRTLDDYREYVAHSEKIYGSAKVIPLRFKR